VLRGRHAASLCVCHAHAHPKTHPVGHTLTHPPSPPPRRPSLPQQRRVSTNFRDHVLLNVFKVALVGLRYLLDNHADIKPKEQVGGEAEGGGVLGNVGVREGDKGGGQGGRGRRRGMGGGGCGGEEVWDKGAKGGGTDEEEGRRRGMGAEGVREVGGGEQGGKGWRGRLLGTGWGRGGGGAQQYSVLVASPSQLVQGLSCCAVRS